MHFGPLLRSTLIALAALTFAGIAAVAALPRRSPSTAIASGFILVCSLVETLAVGVASYRLLLRRANRSWYNIGSVVVGALAALPFVSIWLFVTHS